MSTEKDIISDLGDGLIVRRSTPEDADALAKFNGEVHADPGEDFAEHVALWTRDLLTMPHPTFDPGDFTIVEDSGSGEIVSCLSYISQTWSYEGIEFGVGRSETVGTHPDYRRRGLVRAQFEVAHQWGKERGHMLQAITGIPWYYRLFGYEMAVELGGRRQGYRSHISKLKEGDKEPFNIHPAKEKDIPFITELYNQNTSRYLLACVHDQALWEYALTGTDPDSATYSQIAVIETPQGKAVGFLLHAPDLFGSRFSFRWYELQEGVSWVAVTPSVLRYAEKTGNEYALQKNEKAKNEGIKDHKEVQFESYSFAFGSQHPVYQAAPEMLPEEKDPYAWYLRVPDLIGFLKLITPALEDRLARSYAAGHSAEIKLNFFTSGIILTLEEGKIKAVEPWDTPDFEDSSAQFPELTFTQLLFGYRSLDELDNAYPDCYSNSEAPDAGPLLRALFPKKQSLIWPVS
jgi:GNAT superfamily N-acetyltransferase